MKVKFLKAIGYGIALFAIMFVVGSIVMFGLNLSGTTMSLTMILCGIIVTLLLARQYGVSSLLDGLYVGIIWLVVDALMENLVIVQIFNKGNPALYSPSVFIGYALIVIVPALYGKMKKA